MRQQQTRAIILHVMDYSEWDRIVSLYSCDFGRIRGIAKGAKRSRKRFGSALEPFTLNEVVFVEKENQGLLRLERCRILSPFPEIAQDIKKVVFGHYFLELVNTLTAEKVKNNDVFLLLMHFIELLKKNDFREELLRIFELRLFSLLGYQPEFLLCVTCGRKFSLHDTYKFSVKRGGIVCSKCQLRISGLLPLSCGTIRIFQQAQSLDLFKLGRIFFSRNEHEEGRKIFGEFIKHHMGKKPKSLEVMEQLA